MSILDFLKKIKLPSFEDDFIQDPVEKAMDEAPVVYGGGEIYDTHNDIETLQDQEDQKNGIRILIQLILHLE